MSESLNDHSISELLAFYNDAANQLGRKPLKSFRDKPTALLRTRAILAEVTPKSAAPAAKRGGRGRAPQWTRDPHPSGGIAKSFPREKTLRQRAMVLLTRSEGASLEELAAMMEEHARERGREHSVPVRRRAMGFIPTLRKLYGCALEEPAPGRVRLVVKK